MLTREPDRKSKNRKPLSRTLALGTAWELW
jgi:hypothetical protein